LARPVDSFVLVRLSEAASSFLPKREQTRWGERSVLTKIARKADRATNGTEQAALTLIAKAVAESQEGRHNQRFDGWRLV
jgi:hypothetical protein